MKDFDVGLLPNRSLLIARGGDARALLQGQLSSDLRRLTPTVSAYTSLNSPKGRLLATGFLQQLSDGAIALDLPRSIAPTVLKRLQMFVLRSDVRLSLDANDDPCLIGAFGNPPLQALGLHPPAAPDTARVDGEWLVAWRPGPVYRHALIGPRARLPGIDSDLSERWRAADLAAGVVNLFPETQDHFIAPTAGVETLGGIAYDKGCYTGQEVIARLHYLGQSKRGLYRLSLPSLVAPAAKVHGTEPGDAIGEIVDAGPSPDGPLALAVLQIDRASLPMHVGDIEVSALEAV